MKISKKLSSKSGITIPKLIRLDAGLLPGAAIDLEVTYEGILIKKHSKICRFCGKAEEIITVSGIDMCRSCAADLVREVQGHA